MGRHYYTKNGKDFGRQAELFSEHVLFSHVWDVAGQTILLENVQIKPRSFYS